MASKKEKLPRNINNLPTVRQGRVKVHPGRGIRMNYVWYWAEEFELPEVVGSRVRVRYDPWNASVVYASIGKNWVLCHAKDCSQIVSPVVDEVKAAARRKRMARLDPETAARLQTFVETVIDEGKRARQDRSARTRLNDLSRGTTE